MGGEEEGNQLREIERENLYHQNNQVRITSDLSQEEKMHQIKLKYGLSDEEMKRIQAKNFTILGKFL